MSLTQLFCDVDDFCKVFIPEWEKTQIEHGEKKRRRKRHISTSKIISLIIYYHPSGYGTFKWFYLRYLTKHLSGAFPNAPSYNRFIELLPEVIVPLTAVMQTRCGKGEGIAFVDSTPLRVCKNLRIPRHKTVKEGAHRGKSSTGWFYGFKLHIIVDDHGEILSFSITQGNVDDRKPVPYLAKKVIGKLLGDRGYISKKLTELLATDDVELIRTLRKNMKHRVMTAFDTLLLRKHSMLVLLVDHHGLLL